MSGLSLDAAKDAKEEARSGNLRENDAGIADENGIDYDEHDTIDVKGHPEAMVAFDHIARINIQTFGMEDDDGLLSMEQNLRGGGAYGFALELTLAGAEVVEGQLWKESDGGDFPEFKVIGDPESDANDYELRESVIKDDDGNPVDVETVGIGSLGPSSWDGQPVEDNEISTSHVQVTIPAKKAQSILGALDTAGMYFHDRDGNVVEGLFETPPNFGTDEYDSDEDGFPRLVGYPELRADMDGQAGAIAWTFGAEGQSGNRATDIDVFKVQDESLVALTPLSADDEAYNLPTYPRVNGLYWDHHDSEAADVGADAEPRSSREAVDEAQSMMDSDETTFEDLTDDEKSFVESAENVVGDSDIESVWELDTSGSDTQFDSLNERVDSVRATENITVETDTLARIIDDRIDA